MPTRKRAKPAEMLPRIRIVSGEQIAMGPGKARLLRAISDTGSIRLAARSQKMSYMRAWKLIQTMNLCFRSPLVATARGGEQGGETHLTDMGIRILKLYEGMEEKSKSASESYWRKILHELK